MYSRRDPVTADPSPFPGRAEREGGAAAPDHDRRAVGAADLLAELDEIVEHGAHDQRVEPVAHTHIGRRLAALAVGVDPYGMIPVHADHVVDIGAEADRPSVPLSLDEHLDRGERGVLDRNPALLERRLEPVVPGGVAAKYAREQLDQRFAAYRRAVIEPRPVARDPHVDIAAELLGGGGAGTRRRSRPQRLRQSAKIGLGHRLRLPPREVPVPDMPIDRPTPIDAPPRATEIEALGHRMAMVRDRIGRVIFGQEQVVEQTLITLLAGGHALLIGFPGLGKTRLVETLGTVLGLDDKRVQFTPDLMPADILGSEVMEESESGRRGFRFIQGPVFAQLLMADEINRASPRTQSALLQAMQEQRVSVAGRYHPLPLPFHVLATQNPLEQEGTYPLPEAQLDRFLLQIDIDYPELGAERQMLVATTGAAQPPAEQVMTGDELRAAQQLVRAIPVGESVVEGILDLVRRGRPDTSDLPGLPDQVAWGPGPRASQALMLASRARALLDGRLAPSLDDVLALAGPVLRHRMAVTFAARADGITVDDVIGKLCAPLG